MAPILHLLDAREDTMIKGFLTGIKVISWLAGFLLPVGIVVGILVYIICAL
jgi:hypothetical protein